ncbi:MAG: CRISPR system precrRNA processing endoribonuclease RAMP protein Cas6 [Chloroflexus sp.]
MVLGGLIGSVTLHDVPPATQSLLLAASVVHVGKVCVFGRGQLELAYAH